MTHVQMCSTVSYSTRLLRALSSPSKTLLSSGTRLSTDVPSSFSTEVFFSVSHNSVKLFCLFLAENQIMERAQMKINGNWREHFGTHSQKLIPSCASALCFIISLFLKPVSFRMSSKKNSFTSNNLPLTVKRK